jgi:epoxyqueuosine reductase
MLLGHRLTKSFIVDCTKQSSFLQKSKEVNNVTYGDSRLDIELFEANPSLFLENAIKAYVATSPLNCLTTFNNAPIFDEPVIAFANGDDALFGDLKKVIGDFHLTPREALEKYVQSKRWQRGIKSNMENVGVISWALPIPYETRLSERGSTYGGSTRYNHTRWLGGIFRDNLVRYVVSLLEIMGYNAVDPSGARFSETKSTPQGLIANWSERHIAYVSGLGTFGLNGLMITSKGCAVYLSSVVCDVALTSTPRAYKHYMANCLSYREGSCRRCMERCFGGAISEQGRSNIKCRENVGNQLATLQKLGLDKELIGPAPACGLCSTKTPCEDRIPPPTA